MIPDIHQLLSCHEWANRRIFDAFFQLTDEEWSRDLGSSFPSVQSTAAHLTGTEWIWLERWQGRNPGSAPEWMNAPSPKQLRDVLDEVESRRDVFLKGTGFDQSIRYRLFSGEEYSNNLGELVLHLINHSTYHRGQLAGMMRQLGKKPPSTDFLVFLHQARHFG